ncbi:MAG: hypothetical protein GEV03_28420 [Streptosporangiales bacterium]|nr:hypothetical protein [Streptosporangiales bacterium]
MPYPPGQPWPGYGPPAAPPPGGPRGRGRVWLVIGLVAALIVVVGAGGGGAYWWWTGGPSEGGILLEGDGAQIANKIFASDPNAKGDGSDQQLLDAAAVGETVVAVGVEYGSNFSRPLFLVSEDAGKTWQLATVTAADGGDVPLDEHPSYVVASENGWLAVGGVGYDNAVWTSRDGRTWMRQSDASARAFGDNDRVSDIAPTASGFVAVGYTYPGDDYSSRRPVLWRSGDGVSWQRTGTGRLNLPDKDVPDSFDRIAARGNSVLVTGRLPDSEDAAWLSADGGGTWRRVSVPEDENLSSLGAVAATGEGFLLLKRGYGDDLKRYAAVLSSADGRRWTELGRIDAPSAGTGSGWSELVAGDGGYAVVLGAGYDQGSTLFTSQDGRSWRPAGTLPATGSVVSRAGLAIAGTNTVVAGSQPGGGDDDPVLAVAAGGGDAARVNLRTVPDLIHSDHSLADLATAGGTTLAVGSTNANPAIWASDSRARWARADVPAAESEADARESLTTVANGERGWLAAGSAYRSGVSTRPLVLVSEDGRTWQSVGSDEAFRKEEETPLMPYGAAAGPAGYVVVGMDTAEDYAYESAVAWYSSDLRTWRRSSGAGLTGSESEGRRMSDVTAGPFGFVAVGGAEDPMAPEGTNGRPAVWTSPDGAEWSMRAPPLPKGVESAGLDLVASKGNTIVAMGAAEPTDATPDPGGSTGSTSTSTFAYVSADGGKTWAPAPAPGVGSGGGSRQGAEESFVTDVVPSAGGFTAVGAVGSSGGQDVVLWSSPDGRSWEGQQPEGVGLSGPGEQMITGVTPIGEELVGVGYTADHRQQYSTLWRTELP